MEKYIKDIVDREFSNEYIKTKLNQIIPYICEYFGDNNLGLIVVALRSTTFYVCPFNTPLDRFINDTLPISIDNYYNKFLNSNLINNSNGLSYTEQPYVIYNSNDEAFQLKGIERKIIFVKEPKKNEQNVNEDNIDRVIIHELVQKIKSVVLGNTIRGSRKVNRCGIQTTYFKLNVINDNVNVSFMSESGCGLSKGITEYDTLNIFKNLKNYEFKNDTYPLEVYIVKKLFKNEYLAKLFHEAELYNDVYLLKSYYDDLYYNGAFDNLIKLTDKLVNSNYKNNEEVYEKMVNETTDYLETLELQKGKTLNER